MSEIIEDIKVKKLPLKLRKNGFIYTQVCRGVRSFVYEQTITPKIKYYEVFELRIQHEWEMNGYFYPAKERFPGNEDFGIWAWTCRTLERAMKRFNELEK
jgi:hypothetical protein